MSFEEQVRRIQKEAGWTDRTMLGILIDWLSGECSDVTRAGVVGYLNICKERTKLS